MNPHRYVYGFAYSAPLAAMAAGATLVGLMTTTERESPFKGKPVTLLLVFMLWATVSWLAGLDPEGDYEQWTKIMKIDFMILIALAVLHTKKHIFALTWVIAASLAILGAKGGLFTIMSGGGYRVWGPPGSFIEDNNEFALALVVVIPLLRFLQMQIASAAARLGMSVVMFLCAASALGSQSRGGLLAIATMLLVLWARGRNKVASGFLILIAGASLVAFMPDVWSDRMATISDYDEDQSAMGRISAWFNAWGIALHYPFGVGFNAARPELFAKYSPYFTGSAPAAHSIYFQILGNHGFVGLFLFLSIWLLTFQSAAWLRKTCREIPEARWCADLGAMCQVSLVGYAVGGAFLSLAYFDLPYNIMVLVVLTRVWVERRSWETESQNFSGGKKIADMAGRYEGG